MRLLASILLMLTLAAPAFAAKPCPSCKAQHTTSTSRHAPKGAANCTARAAEPTFASQLKSGFKLVGGFRWDHSYTQSSSGPPSPVVSDPLFYGAQLSLPLSTQENVDVYGRWVRDWGQAPNYHTEVGVTWAPWK